MALRPGRRRWKIFQEVNEAPEIVHVPPSPEERKSYKTTIRSFGYAKSGTYVFPRPRNSPNHHFGLQDEQSIEEKLARDSDDLILILKIKLYAVVCWSQPFGSPASAQSGGANER